MANTQIKVTNEAPPAGSHRRGRKMNQHAEAFDAAAVNACTTGTYTDMKAVNAARLAISQLVNRINKKAGKTVITYTSRSVTEGDGTVTLKVWKTQDDR